MQFGKDTPLYVGYEEKREMSAWKFEAWIAPRSAYEEKEEEEPEVHAGEMTPKER